MAFAAETICVQGSNERRDPFGAISMPIYQNAAYAHPGLGKSTGYDYSRCGNPTRDEVQKTVALLEQGTEALAFSTGMAAITALMEIFSPGDHLIATDAVEVELDGTWENSKHGLQLSVSMCKEVVPRDQAGILAYLSSDMSGDESDLSRDSVQPYDEGRRCSGNRRIGTRAWLYSDR